MRWGEQKYPQKEWLEGYCRSLGKDIGGPDWKVVTKIRGGRLFMVGPSVMDQTEKWSVNCFMICTAHLKMKSSKVKKVMEKLVGLLHEIHAH